MGIKMDAPLVLAGGTETFCKGHGSLVVLSRNTWMTGRKEEISYPIQARVELG